MIYQLNLPHPSQQLLDLVEKFVKGTTLNLDNKRWLDEFHNGTVNSSQHLFAPALMLTDQLQLEYSNFFTNPIGAVVGIMHNTSQSIPSCQPPHVDRGRALAINYYIELGGDNVQTVYYNKQLETDSESSTNYRYSDVKKIGQYCFKKNNWYAYNVSQCHSVENIQTTRYFLSIVILESPETYTVDDLILKNSSITFDKCELNLYN
jgi:hypothetical protein